MIIKPLVYVDEQAILRFRDFKKTILPFISILTYDVHLDITRHLTASRTTLRINFNEDGAKLLARLEHLQVSLRLLFKTQSKEAYLTRLTEHHFNIIELTDNLIVVNLSKPSRRTIF